MNLNNNSSVNHISNEHNVMILTGRGQVTAVPNVAVLRLGVQTTGDNLSLIQEENARLSQAVLQTLQQMNITDIQTFQYEINRLFEFENGNRVDRGFSVRNIFEIRTSNMDNVGQIIDAAVAQGANVVDLISFEVSDSDDYYMAALNMAVYNAYLKAQSITGNLGIVLDPIPKKIIENSASPAPLRNTFSREVAFVTPIEPGNLQIEASVTVEFQY